MRKLDTSCYSWKCIRRWVGTDTWRWSLGLLYIVAVAAIWIAASYIVQSVVDSGVSPFLITYICNSLFIIYIPIVEFARYFEDSLEKFWLLFSNKNDLDMQRSGELENINLLQENDHQAVLSVSNLPEEDNTLALPESTTIVENSMKQVDEKGRWTRTRVARVSLLICPFWFFAQLTFNLSLKYTTVTVSINRHELIVGKMYELSLSYPNIVI